MEQLLLHLIGDYLTQSHWMAINKTKSSLAALIHVSLYSVPFLLIGSARAFLVIWITHFLIDRFRLARFVVFAKNMMGPHSTNLRCRWRDASPTGYQSDIPTWMAVWLLIVADNTLHLAINYSALRWL